MRDIFGGMSVLGYDKLYRQPRDIITSVFNTKYFETVSLWVEMTEARGLFFVSL